MIFIAILNSVSASKRKAVIKSAAGVLLADGVFAKELRLQFEALINRGLVKRLAVGAG